MGSYHGLPRTRQSVQDLHKGSGIEGTSRWILKLTGAIKGNERNVPITGSCLRKLNITGKKSLHTKKQSREKINHKISTQAESLSWK